MRAVAVINDKAMPRFKVMCCYRRGERGKSSRIRSLYSRHVLDEQESDTLPLRYAGQLTMKSLANALPLYDQLKFALIQAITAGKYPVGHYLPAEPQLCERHNVSRITVRRAVEELCREGYLKKVRGKGTLVIYQKVNQTLVSLTGFTESMAQLGRKTDYQILATHCPAADRTAQVRLGAGRAEEVVHIERLISVDGHPLTLEHLYFNKSVFPGVREAVEQGRSFYESLQRLHGARPEHTERVINVVFASPDECERLRCQASDPVYRIEKLTQDTDRIPLGFSIMITPVSRITYTISE